MSGLPAGLRRRLERGFGADLGAVSLHTGAMARAICRSYGAHGVAYGEQIFVACDDPEDTAALPLMVHEVTHILQKRLAGAPNETRAEQEARCAARIIPAGGRLRIAAPSDPRRVSRWGEVGHYYTVYLVMLAAGVAEKEAASIAFFAQLPDEALELDAIPAAINIVVAPGLAIGSWEVQIGLHALSGISQTSEFARRIKIFDDLSPADPNFLLAFGLACHAFGDCYAHQKNGVMYSPPLGHLFDSHGPDTISEATFEHYRRYVTVLHGVARTKFHTKQMRMPADMLAQRLRGLTGISSDVAQARFIRDLAGSLPGLSAALSPYDPLAADALPIWEVQWRYPAYFQSLPADVLARSRALAREWMARG